MAGDQRPKNSHNRMITGIGTPSSQSKIPRPMVSSLQFLTRKENAEGQAGFRQQERKKVSSVSGVGHWCRSNRRPSFTVSEIAKATKPVLESKVMPRCYSPCQTSSRGGKPRWSESSTAWWKF
jgi:hypothetical protein